MIQIIADNLKAVHQHRILIDFTRIEAKTNYSEITTSPNCNVNEYLIRIVSLIDVNYLILS